MRILAVDTAFPSYRYPQEVITETLQKRLGDNPELSRAMGRLHRNCGVEHRNLSFPIETLDDYRDFGPSNSLWIKTAVDLGEQAIQAALTSAGLTPKDISAIFFTSVTGLACPSIDARLANRMGFPSSVKRTPIFGLGCVAGAAGISRVADYLRAFPKQYAILLSVELCTLTWQHDDVSLAHIIASGLFGDGAAAVVMGGEETTLARFNANLTGYPRVLDTRSTFYPDTEHIMGWDINEKGFNIVLSPDVPKIVLENLKGNVDGFLAEHGLTIPDISSWIFHSGGPKVLQAIEAALNIPKEALESSYNSLRNHGNLSSASVLTVLRDFMLNKPGKPGSYGLIGAMGPAFCSELGLVQW